MLYWTRSVWHVGSDSKFVRFFEEWESDASLILKTVCLAFIMSFPFDLDSFGHLLITFTIYFRKNLLFPCTEPTFRPARCYIQLFISYHPSSLLLLFLLDVQSCIVSWFFGDRDLILMKDSLGLMGIFWAISQRFISCVERLGSSEKLANDWRPCVWKTASSSTMKPFTGFQPAAPLCKVQIWLDCSFSFKMVALLQGFFCNWFLPK